MSSSAPSPKVTLREVGLRDGLQSIQTILPTAQKIDWMRAAYAAGQYFRSEMTRYASLAKKAGVSLD